jgi:hypothetical protein
MQYLTIDVSDPWQIGTIVSTVLGRGNQHSSSYHRCLVHNIKLLKGEHAWFCCGIDGKYFNNIIHLPPLFLQYAAFINHLDISLMSHVLNLIFSFVLMETTHPFPTVPGPPGFFAIQGCIYHCLQPNHNNSAVCWLLYDSFMCTMVPFKHLVKTLPPNWVGALQDALLDVNSLIGHFHLSNF